MVRRKVVALPQSLPPGLWLRSGGRRRNRRWRETRSAQRHLVRCVGAVCPVAHAVSRNNRPLAASEAEGDADLREGTLAGRERLDGERAAGRPAGGRLNED